MRHMATRRTVLSQTERALLREALITTHAAYVTRRGTSRSPTKHVELAKLHAQLLLNAYRQLTWSNH